MGTAEDRERDEWCRRVDERLDEGDARMTTLETKLDENTEITTRIDKGVGEILTIFAALKGFVTVGGWVGTAIKYIAGILIAVGIIWLVWKTGDLPRKP